MFTWSAWSGIDKGIKTLSNVNMFLAFIVLIGLFIVGPTLYILNTFTNGLGNYIFNFFSMSLRIPMNGGEKFQWLQNWTIFYWAWWVSWAPFVGIFIARVSRGRTIKEFILGVLFVLHLYVSSSLLYLEHLPFIYKIKALLTLQKKLLKLQHLLRWNIIH